MAPFASRGLPRPVIAEVKWLADILGKARDWDVFLSETLPPLSAWFIRDANSAPGIKRVRERATRRRLAARKDARAAVSSPRLQRLLLAAGFRLHAIAVRCAGRAARDRARRSAEGARSFAAKLLTRRHRKFAGLAATLVQAANEERHAARIAAKRLRYGAEFFAPLFPGKAHAHLPRNPRRRAGRARPIQRRSHRGRAGERAVRLADDAASGAVRGWVAAQAAALEPDLAKAVRRFTAAKPFWSPR
jgi:inorganic triphosphatase YgiF